MHTTSEIERRYGDKGVHAWSVHPGVIMTGLAKQVYARREMLESWAPNAEVGQAVKSVEQGAATTVWAAAANDLESRGGKYLVDCQMEKPIQKDRFKEWESGYLPYAYDEDKKRCLGRSPWSSSGLS